MGTERVSGVARVMRVLGQGGRNAPLDLAAPPCRASLADGARVASRKAHAVLAALLATTLPDPEAAAVALLDRFGSLAAVLDAAESELALIPGVTAAALIRAARAAAAAVLEERFEREAIGGWPALERWLRLTLAGSPAERLIALYLDRGNGLIYHEALGEGPVGGIALRPSTVARRPLALHASAVILVHNNPWDDPAPSPHDVRAVRAIADCLVSLDIALHDHVTVGRGRFASMREEALL